MLPGGRVFVCVPKNGYVGVGVVKDRAVRVKEFTVNVNGIEKSILDVPFKAPKMAENSEDEELSDTLHTLVGILMALKSDYEAGYLQLIQELIHADIFADFFEMAEYLLEQGFKDPAAVLIGGVLEEHLRKLCNKNSRPITVKDRPKKADSMNSELAGLKIYGKLEQKSVTAWLDLRNKAAHGKYNEYTYDQVKVMLMSAREFVSRFPA